MSEPELKRKTKSNNKNQTKETSELKKKSDIDKKNSVKRKTVIKKRRKAKKKSFVKLILSLIILIISLIFVFFINGLGVLPSKYLYLIVVFVFVINTIAMVLLLSKGIVKNLISALIYIVILVISGFGIKYSSNTIDYLNKGFSNNAIEYTTYNVIVLSDSNYTKFEDLKNSNMGYLFIELDNDEYLNKVKKAIDVNLSQMDVSELYNGLVSKKIDSILINDAYISMLEEEIKDFSIKTRILHSFSIESKKENSNEKLKELKPVNIYISGSDSRSGKISSRSGSDVNIIVTLNPDTHTILLTNIPRDYYVQLHGTTGLKDKLTHSGIYGIDMSKNTIEDFMGIDIDYTVKVGFQSVIKLVDLVGGIDVYSDIAFRTHCGDGGAKRVYIKVGKNHLNGAQALSFARERYAYSDGDRQRGKNQQQVIQAIFNKMISDKSILLKYDSLLNSFSSLYRTDIPKDFVTLLIKHQLENMSSWEINTQSVDGTGASKKTYSMPGYDNLYVMIPNEETINNAKIKINEVLNQK